MSFEDDRPAPREISPYHVETPKELKPVNFQKGRLPTVGFKKGMVNPNPGGRPRLRMDLINIARDHTPEALEKLMEFVRGSVRRDDTVFSISAKHRMRREEVLALRENREPEYDRVIGQGKTQYQDITGSELQLQAIGILLERALGKAVPHTPEGMPGSDSGSGAPANFTRIEHVIVQFNGEHKPTKVIDHDEGQE